MNTGSVAQVLDSIIFSLWAVPDLGDYNDDLASADTLRKSCFAYNEGSVINLE